MTQALATVICCSVSITVRSLIFGVAYDDTVVGLEKVQLASEKFSEIVKTKLEPEFSFSFEKVGGKTLFRYLFTASFLKNNTPSHYGPSALYIPLPRMDLGPCQRQAYSKCDNTRYRY